VDDRCGATLDHTSDRRRAPTTFHHRLSLRPPTMRQQLSTTGYHYDPQPRLRDSHTNRSQISNVLSQQPPLLSNRSIESSVLQNMRFRLSLSSPRSILQSPIGRLKNIKRRNVGAAAKSTHMPTVRDRSFAPTKTNQGYSNKQPKPAKNTTTRPKTARPTRNDQSTVTSRMP
jgi:hypothetical protein